MAVPFSTIHRWDFCRALYLSHYNKKIVFNYEFCKKKYAFFDIFAQYSHTVSR